jgi:hypothetical protein
MRGKAIRKVSMSLFLMLFGGAKWALAQAGQQVGPSQQQLAEPQSKETTQLQKAQPAKPESVDGLSAGESSSALTAQFDTLANQPTQGKEAQGATQPQEQSGTKKPSGTAAAESEKMNGVAAFNPTGVAIAPAKQHRRRAFWVKLGAVAGAGMALGTAMGLSRSSPGRPPGSH